MLRLVLGWADVAGSQMSTIMALQDLDMAEDHASRVRLRVPVASQDQLEVPCDEEALGHRVMVTLTAPAHARQHAVHSQFRLIRHLCVLGRIKLALRLRCRPMGAEVAVKVKRIPHGHAQAVPHAETEDHQKYSSFPASGYS